MPEGKTIENKTILRRPTPPPQGFVRGCCLKVGLFPHIENSHFYSSLMSQRPSEICVEVINNDIGLAGDYTPFVIMAGFFILGISRLFEGGPVREVADVVNYYVDEVSPLGNPNPFLDLPRMLSSLEALQPRLPLMNLNPQDFTRMVFEIENAITNLTNLSDYHLALQNYIQSLRTNPDLDSLTGPEILELAEAGIQVLSEDYPVLHTDLTDLYLNPYFGPDFVSLLQNVDNFSILLEQFISAYPL